MAKQGQVLHLHKNLSKNVLLVILPYLHSNEGIRLILSNKNLYSKLTSDPYFFVVMNEAYMKFFLR